MKLQSAIKELDRLVTWGFSNGKINGKLLTGFQGVIKILLEIDDQGKVTPDEISSRVASELTSLRFISKATGITPKAVQMISELDADFIEWYEVHGTTIHTNLDFQVMLSIKHTFDKKVNIDLENIKFYSKLKKIDTERGDDKMQPYLKFFYELCPHLQPWLELIDKGETIDEMQANNELYKYHLWSSKA